MNGERPLFFVFNSLIYSVLRSFMGPETAFTLSNPVQANGQPVIYPGVLKQITSIPLPF